MDKANLLDVVHKAGKLKTTARTGWAIKGVSNVESVADHCWRVSFLATLLADEFGLDKTKVTIMSIFHDIGEASIGDIRWEQGKEVIGNKERKHDDELDAVKTLFKDDPNLQQYVDLYSEFNDKITPEAKFVKGLDKLEMAMQALEYEQQGNPPELFDEFWTNAEKYLNGTNLEGYFRELQQERTRNRSKD